jgi:hypothetical protein
MKGILPLRSLFHKYQVNRPLSVSYHERVLLPLIRGWSAVCQPVRRAGTIPRTMVIGEYNTGESEH